MEDKTIELKTRIDGVIVYQTGVQVILGGTINLAKGDQLIKTSDLPETIDKESIRVKGLGNGKIINISVEFNSKKEYKTEEYKKSNEEREKLEKEIKKIEKNIERYNYHISKFKSTEDNFYSLWSKAYAFGETDLSKFSIFNEKMNDYISSKIKAISDLEEQLKQLKSEYQVILNKISKLGPLEEINNFYEIKINLNVLREGDFKFEIKYTMRQCWWVPFYDVALSEKNARLTMMANVYNQTGQDWENVSVEISTASLNPIMLVKPNPTILQEYVPQYKQTSFSGKGGDRFSGEFGGIPPSQPIGKLGRKDQPEDFAQTQILLPAEKKVELKESYAEVAENIGVQTFKISNRITIPSDKNPHPVNLTLQELDVEKKYYWSSAIPESVIVQNTLVNGDLLLLAGNVKIYYLEEFLGETNIPIIAPKERFKLGTRISYDIKVDKKLIDRSKDKKPVKGRLKNNYEYKITIKNLSGATEELIVYDRVPHSYSENIKVEIDNLSPEPYKKELGLLKWKFNLKDLKETVIKYKYIIDYKKGVIITPPLP